MAPATWLWLVLPCDPLSLRRLAVTEREPCEYTARSSRMDHEHTPPIFADSPRVRRYQHTRPKGPAVAVAAVAVAIGASPRRLTSSQHVACLPPTPWHLGNAPLQRLTSAPHLVATRSMPPAHPLAPRQCPFTAPHLGAPHLVATRSMPPAHPLAPRQCPLPPSVEEPPGMVPRSHDPTVPWSQAWPHGRRHGSMVAGIGGPGRAIRQSNQASAAPGRAIRQSH